MTQNQNQHAYITFMNERLSYLKNVERQIKSDPVAYYRENYTDESSQIYAEYLDYVEDWTHTYDFLVDENVIAFVHHVLAVRGQAIPCQDHVHNFTTDPKLAPNVVVNEVSNVDSTKKRSTVLFNRDFPINKCQCWFQTVKQAFIDLRDDAQRLVSLPPILELLLKTISRRSCVKIDDSSVLLTFESFRQQWWSCNTKKRACGLLKQLPEFQEFRHSSLEKSTLHETRDIENIYDAKDVQDDHGFHLLVNSHPNPQLIIDKMNNIRVTSTDEPPILLNETKKAIASCTLCKKFGTAAKPLSYPGVYYAPPGNGKTSLATTEIFVGLDTDWLTRGGDNLFRRLLVPFLRMDIPIITNQYMMAKHSGIKFHGTFNKAHLRDSSRGVPWTSSSDIQEAEKILDEDLFVKHYSGGECYLDTTFIYALIGAYCQSIIGKKFFRTKYPKKSVLSS